MIFLIPARSGSKRIKNKNIAKVHNKLLIDFTLDLFENSELKKKVFISTNSRKVMEICKKRRFNYFTRPQKLASDKSRIEETILHFLSKDKKIYHKQKWLILLQVTSPLRNRLILTKFIKFLNKQRENINTVISVSKTKKDFWKESKGRLVRLNPKAPRREQERKSIYEENGLFYAVKINYFLKQKYIVSGNIKKFVTPKEISLDINDKFDLNLFKRLVGKELQ